jgi:hypothetical protein
MNKINKIEESLIGMDKLPTSSGIAVKILEAVKAAKKESSNINEIADANNEHKNNSRVSCIANSPNAIIIKADPRGRHVGPNPIVYFFP